MAKKRFYYDGKNRRPEGDAAPQAATTREAKQGRRKRPAASRAAAAPAPLRYTEEKRALTLAELGVDEALSGLLASKGIATAGDLVSRTERDMFRVQGFNKKMLLRLKKCLNDREMDFLPAAADGDRPAAQKGEAREQTRRSGEREDSRRGASPDSRRDRAREGRPGDRKKPAPVREERPKKLTEPLPVPEWRKVQKNGKWGFFDGFNTVIPAIYDEVFFFKDGLAAVENEEKCGYIDPTGEVVIPLMYETAMSFSEGLASVVSGGKCGYINKQNEVVIPFVYDAATPFEGGEAKVKKDGRWGTLFPDGTVRWIV